MDLWMVWRRHLMLWLVPLIALVLGITSLGIYRASFAGRKESMDSLAEKAEAKWHALQEQRSQVESFLVRVETQKKSIDAVYNERFATESERFTRFLREVRELARMAGLDPSSFSYPNQVLESEGLVKRNVTFSISGSYEDLRRFVNFLELSDQFVTLEEISIAGQGQLDLRFSISTLFVLKDPERLDLSSLQNPERRTVRVGSGAGEEEK